MFAKSLIVILNTIYYLYFQIGNLTLNVYQVKFSTHFYRRIEEVSSGWSPQFI